MRRQSRAIKGELEHKVDAALESANVRRGIVAVALLAVLREGIEAALFLIAAATEENGRDVVVGAILGLAIATGLAVMVYVGGRSLPMKAFFKVTGVILIVFAAGLARGPCCSSRPPATSARGTSTASTTCGSTPG